MSIQILWTILKGEQSGLGDHTPTKPLNDDSDIFYVDSFTFVDDGGGDIQKIDIFLCLVVQ